MIDGWSEIGWLRPEWLVLLALVPIAAGAIAWSIRRRRRALDVFAEAEVRGRTQTLPAGPRLVRGALLVLALAGVVTAAAGPQWGTERIAAPPVAQQVVFALDVSRSMLARDANPSRLDRARLAIRQILASLPAAEAGLVVFAGEASLVVPLTRDISAIELYLASTGPDWISDPSTDLGNAVKVALEAFGPDRAPGRAIVVLSDGEDHAGNAAVEARAAREPEVQIETVGVGTQEGARIPIGGAWLESGGEVVVTRLDPEPLAEMAAVSGGVSVTLDGPGEDMATLIARLRSLDTGRAEGQGSERRADRYRWPLAPAVLALGIEAILRARGLRARRRMEPGLAIAAAALLLGMGRPQAPADLYEEGRYRDALAAWRTADRSPGAEPHDAYNRGNAAYRLAEHREAAAAYAVAARTAGERIRASEAWYNAGNARFRIAEGVEAGAGGAENEGRSSSARYWDSAVAAYRKALLRDSNDRDAKHNLELALRRRNQAGGGGGGGGAGGGGGEGGGAGGGGRGIQPPSSQQGGGEAEGGMTRAEAERLLDALAAQEREALVREEGEERGGVPQEPGW
ncbi:MAG TPA: VWA domain-containing protein [Gemmatimonadota bacterium]|nr:VWA domain-containing protein [Gemmatimonadota bacterium]